MSFRWFRHEHIIFDCDSTLSKIEGIDELAKIGGVSHQVKQMTDAAMAGEIGLEEVYGKRLQLINPKREDILKLKEAYKNTATEDAKTIIDYLKNFGHKVYIVSGGLLEPVREFGISLGIEQENIFAVGVNYNQLSGQWWLSGDPNKPAWSPEYLDFHQSPLTLSEGKKTIISRILENKSGRSMLIGDGMSDFLASSCVDQFIGYGGVVSRDNVAKNSQVFVSSPSLLPILPLAGGEKLIQQLRVHDETLLLKTLHLLETQTVFTDPKIKPYFLQLFK